MKYKKIFQDAMDKTGITLDDICKTMGLTYAPDVIERWLSGRGRPYKLIDRIKFCDYLGVEYKGAATFSPDPDEKPEPIVEKSHTILILDTRIPDDRMWYVNQVFNHCSSVEEFFETMLDGPACEPLIDKMDTWDWLNWCYKFTNAACFTLAVIHALETDKEWAKTIFGIEAIEVK